MTAYSYGNINRLVASDHSGDYLDTVNRNYMATMVALLENHGVESHQPPPVLWGYRMRVNFSWTAPNGDVLPQEREFIHQENPQIRWLQEIAWQEKRVRGQFYGWTASRIEVRFSDNGGSLLDLISSRTLRNLNSFGVPTIVDCNTRSNGAFAE